MDWLSSLIGAGTVGAPVLIMGFLNRRLIQAQARKLDAQADKLTAEAAVSWSDLAEKTLGRAVALEKRLDWAMNLLGRHMVISKQWMKDNPACNGEMSALQEEFQAGPPP